MPRIPIPVSAPNSLNQDLGWVAQSVVVDNYSSGWLYIPGAQRYVAPQQLNVTIPIPATQQAEAIWQAPPGQSDTANAGDQATLTYYSEALPPSGAVYALQSVQIEPGSAPIQISGNITGTITGTVDANITNASLDVTGTVSIGNTPAVTVDTSGGPVSISGDVTVSGSVNATITNASIAVTGTVDVGTLTSITDPISVSGTVNVQGVSGGTAIGIAGTVDIGNTPSVTIDTSGGPVSISGDVTVSGSVNATITNASIAVTGTVSADITNSSLTVTGSVSADITNSQLDITGPVSISAGQNGVNVSTDSPPVLWKTLVSTLNATSIAGGSNTPTNALAFEISVDGPNLNTVASGLQYTLSVTNSYTGEVVAQSPQLPTDQGTTLYVIATPEMVTNGLEWLLQLVGGHFSLGGEQVGSVGYYLSPNVIFPSNTVDQPLYDRGPIAQGLAGAGSALVDVDQVVSGQWAAQVAGGGSTYPAWPDVAVMGTAGASKQALKTSPEAPQLNIVVNTTLASGGSVTLIPSIAGESIRLRRMQLQTSTNNQIVLRSVAGGGELFWVGTPGAGGSTPDLDFEGWALPPNIPLVLQNVGGSGVSITGRITADQY